ncbi:MAG: DUF4124 domain-containing protein [Methylococcaceae bacterium]
MITRQLLFAIALCLPVCCGAQVSKCTDAAGRVTYQNKLCVGVATKADQIQVPTSRSRAELKVEVSDDVVQECFEGYRVLSLDPTDVKFLGHTASVVPAGFPVLYVSAVLKNKFGGPDQRLLWCKLTDDLKLDKREMEKKWRDFYIELHG